MSRRRRRLRVAWNLLRRCAVGMPFLGGPTGFVDNERVTVRRHVRLLAAIARTGRANELPRYRTRHGLTHPAVSIARLKEP